VSEDPTDKEEWIGEYRKFHDQIGEMISGSPLPPSMVVSTLLNAASLWTLAHQPLTLSQWQKITEFFFLKALGNIDWAKEEQDKQHRGMQH
jgi:hypothetical protein